VRGALEGSGRAAPWTTRPAVRCGALRVHGLPCFGAHADPSQPARATRARAAGRRCDGCAMRPTPSGSQGGTDAVVHSTTWRRIGCVAMVGAGRSGGRSGGPAPDRAGGASGATDRCHGPMAAGAPCEPFGSQAGSVTRSVCGALIS
jgi:hypothetical protein